MTPSEEVRLYAAGREARASMGAFVLSLLCVAWVVTAAGALIWVGAS